ncbi:MAG TPA: hypothetical protein VGJ26_21430 [Pirellulales bacterium]
MSWLQKLDDYGRRHPAQMLLFVVLVTIFLTVPALLYNSQGTVVLYQAF